MDEQEKSQGKPSPLKTIEDGIGIRLKTARETRGLSQSDLHNKTGLSRTVLINYEAGRHKPGARELRLLCDALEVSPNHLIYGTEEPHSRNSGLADTVLNMGEGAIALAVFLGPMLGAMLGKDDTRIVLSLIESLLKAKDPIGYAHVMKLVDVFSKFHDKSREEQEKQIAELQSNPEAGEKFQKEIMEHVMAARTKAGSA